MKTSSLLVKASALSFLLFFAIRSSSQSVCGDLLENFDNTSGSMAGFSGDLALAADGSNGFLEKRQVISSGLYTVSTPVFELAPTADYVGFGFGLSGTERIARVEAAILYVSSLNNQMTTIFLGQFVPSYSAGASTVDICRAVSLSDMPGFPANGQYRLRIELTPNTGAGQLSQFIRFDEFKTNGTRAQSLLPLAFVAVETKKVGSQWQLVWKVAGEEKILRYEAEGSMDGHSFEPIGQLANTHKNHYTLYLATGDKRFFRVKAIDEGGRPLYSKIVQITGGKALEVSAYPHPVRNALTIQHPAAGERSAIQVFSVGSRLLQQYGVVAGSRLSRLDFSALPPGLYLVQFVSGDDTATVKIIKQ